MSDDLIARLRKYSKQLLPCTHEAADALEAQARRIAELEKDDSRTDTHTAMLCARIAELEAENERILDLLAKFVDDLRAARDAYKGEKND
jgi:hypothetical protein